jgi:hypothetical protein
MGRTRLFIRATSILACVVGLVWLAATPMAAVTDFVASTTKLAVSGQAGATLTTSFTLTSTDKRALAAPVVEPPTSGTAIDAGAVTITPDRSELVPGLPQVFRVSVVAPATVGSYAAFVTVRFVPVPGASAQPSFTADIVRLELAVTVEAAPPAPAPSQELSTVGSLKATRVSCEPTFECPVAAFLLGPSAVDRSVSVVVQNPGAVAAAPTQGAFLALGDRSNTALTATNVPLTSAASIEPGRLGALVYTVPQQQQPDHYVGQLSVQLTGVTKPVTAGVDLTIRQGPLVPALLLLVGLAFGYALRQARKTVLPEGDAVARVEGLRKRLADTPTSPRELAVLSERIEDAWKALKEGRTATATAMLDAIDDSLAILDGFQRVELSLQGRNDASARLARRRIKEGRCMIEIGEKGAANLDGARQLLQQAAGDARPLAPSAGEGGLALPQAAPPASAAPGDERVRRSAPPLTPGQVQRDQSQERRLEDARSARTPIRVVLVGLALLTGLYALYVAPSSVLIGGSFADIASLLLWGIGSGWVDKVFLDWG